MNSICIGLDTMSNDMIKDENDDEYENDNEYMSCNDHHVIYKHFSNIKDCKEFLDYLDNSNIKTTHICCGGYGCGISKTLFPNVDTIISDYAFYRTNKTKYKESAKMIECCVCYENTRRVTLCGHALCESCVTQLQKQDCPCCRQNI